MLRKKIKIKKADLHRHSKPWTSREENLLRKLYPDSITPDLVERFGRTAGAICLKANALGLYKNWLKYTLRPYENRKLWSDKEIKRLKKLYPATQNSELLKHFPGRDETNIMAKANRLGLKKKYLNPPALPESYTTELWRDQKALFAELYPVMSIDELAKKFGRSKAAVSRLAVKMGLRKKIKTKHWKSRKGIKGKLWTPNEEARLRKLYPTHDIIQLAATLNRSKRAIVNKIHQLRLKDPQVFGEYTPPEEWSEKDIKKLRRLRQQGKNYREIAELIGKNSDSVRYQIARQIQNFQLQKKHEPPERWSKKEIAYLTQHYQNTPIPQLCTVLKKTKTSIYHKARRLELKK